MRKRKCIYRIYMYIPKNMHIWVDTSSSNPRCAKANCIAFPISGYDKRKKNNVIQYHRVTFGWRREKPLLRQLSGIRPAVWTTPGRLRALAPNPAPPPPPCRRLDTLRSYPESSYDPQILSHSKRASLALVFREDVYFLPPSPHVWGMTPLASAVGLGPLGHPSSSQVW